MLQKRSNIKEHWEGRGKDFTDPTSGQHALVDPNQTVNGTLPRHKPTDKKCQIIHMCWSGYCDLVENQYVGCPFHSICSSSWEGEYCLHYSSGTPESLNANAHALSRLVLCLRCAGSKTLSAPNSLQFEGNKYCYVISRRAVIRRARLKIGGTQRPRSWYLRSGPKCARVNRASTIVAVLQYLPETPVGRLSEMTSTWMTVCLLFCTVPDLQWRQMRQKVVANKEAHEHPVIKTTL